MAETSCRGGVRDRESHWSTSAALATPRILIIDHHDSYTLNLLICLQEATQCTATQLLSRTVVLPHNHALLSSPELFSQQILPHFDALILGPGPGHPDKDDDFGPASRILRSILDGHISIPTFGVCLGHQGIAVACGGKVVRADTLRHGLSSLIEIVPDHATGLTLPSLFQADGSASSYESPSMIRYNSLTVDASTLPDNLVVTAWSYDSSSQVPPPHYNVFSPVTQTGTATGPSSGPSERSIMGLQHRTLPLWGVQFHPESISSEGGKRLMRNFLDNCRQFWLQSLQSTPSEGTKNLIRQRMSSWSQSTPITESTRRLMGSPLLANSLSKSFRGLPPLSRHNQFKISTRTLLAPLPSYNQSDLVFESLRKSSSTSVWLDSSREGDPQSRFSYLAVPSWQISYDASCGEVALYSSTSNGVPEVLSTISIGTLDAPDVSIFQGLPTPKTTPPGSPDGHRRERGTGGFWDWLSAVQESMKESTAFEANNEDRGSFKTGFVGYFDYEMRNESLTRGKRSPIEGSETLRDSSQANLPSAWWAFCDRVVAFDHVRRVWFAIVLLHSERDMLVGKEAAELQTALQHNGMRLGVSEQEASEWMTELQATLTGIAKSAEQHATATKHPSMAISAPLPSLTPCDSAEVYKDKVEAARAYIANGESYELCLTNRFEGGLTSTGEGTTQTHEDGYRIYKALRRKNPAPFSAFLDLGGGRSILSTSPERFMTIDADGRVEMRPIKGTLARAGFREGDLRHENSDEASTWRRLEDERRRKMLQCNPKERAENLMIVDLIRADLLSFCSPDSVLVPSLMQVESYESVHQLVTTIVGHKSSSVTAVDALKRCFPPGSMTGAPKVRSVEIIQILEGRPRGIYSGILGWLGLDGATSTSVVIRTVVLDAGKVSVGAGGAITYLSNPEGEWQEVLDKVAAIATVAV